SLPVVSHLQDQRNPTSVQGNRDVPGFSMFERIVHRFLGNPVNIQHNCVIPNSNLPGADELTTDLSRLTNPICEIAQRVDQAGGAELDGMQTAGEITREAHVGVHYLRCLEQCTRDL